MTPAFVNYDYHFFYLHGPEMAVVCIFFLVCWFMILALGSTAAGIAVFTIYGYATSGRVPAPFGKNPVPDDELQ